MTPPLIMLGLLMTLLLIVWLTVRARRLHPISISCESVINLPAEQIAFQILDLNKWQEFNGYGVLPGIRSAEFDLRTEGIIGTRIRVTNSDGSSHTEEILQWQPEERIKMELKEFSPPLCYLATHFVEQWDFTQQGTNTHLKRTFELNSRSSATRPLLWLISCFLKGAIQRHLQQIRESALQNS